MKANLFFVLFSLLLFQLQPMFGGKPKLIEYDKTAYFERFFADESEFDIRTFKSFPHREIIGDDWRELAIFQTVQPIPEYVYWELRYYDDDYSGPHGRVVYKRGYRCPVPLVDSTFAEVSPGRTGFLIKGHHSFSFSRIVAVRKDGTVDLIYDNEHLIEFLGPVDNLEELWLHIRARGYRFDKWDLIAGAYKEEEDRYLLYLTQRTPGKEYDESVKAILYKDGRKFEEISRVRYRQRNVIFSA